MVGFYEAPERVGEKTLSRVGEQVATKIKETNFQTPVALVVSFWKLWEGASVLPISDAPYSLMDPSWVKGVTQHLS